MYSIMGWTSESTFRIIYTCKTLGEALATFKKYSGDRLIVDMLTGEIVLE